MTLTHADILKADIERYKRYQKRAWSKVFLNMGFGLVYGGLAYLLRGEPFFKWLFAIQAIILLILVLFYVKLVGNWQELIERNEELLPNG